MTKDEQIKLLKDFCCYLANLYQTNYEMYASYDNCSAEVKKEVSSDVYSRSLRVITTFNCAQKTNMISLIERLAYNNKNKKLTCDINELLNIFSDIEKTECSKKTVEELVAKLNYIYE